MADIGVREPKANASAILRQVRERGVQYVVTLRGEPVGLLLPLEATGEPRPAGAPAWDELTSLSIEIGRAWNGTQSTSEILAGQRR